VSRRGGARDRAHLLLLAPSRGFGGGIERVTSSLEREWPGPVTRVDLYRAGIERAGDRSVAVKGRFAVRALAAALRPGSRPALALSLHIGLLPVALAAARVSAARTGLFVHGAEAWGPAGLLCRSMVQHCDLLAAQSSFATHWFCERARVDASRVNRLPAVIDPALEHSARVQPTTYRQSPRPTLLTVSRIDPVHDYKGHFAIAEALPEVLARRPRTTWTVVGAGEDRPRLERRCAELGIAHATRFAGRVGEDALYDLYRSATVFVLPSFADVDPRRPAGEGFGLVFAEAGAFGLPIISSAAAGGESELLQHGVTALTVPRGQPAPLSAAIVRLLEDPALRERLGSQVRARVLANHTPARLRAALEEIAGFSPSNRPSPGA